MVLTPDAKENDNPHKRTNEQRAMLFGLLGPKPKRGATIMSSARATPGAAEPNECSLGEATA